MTRAARVACGASLRWAGEGTCPWVICASQNAVTYITASHGNNPYFVLLSERFAFAGEGEGESKHPYCTTEFMKRKSYFVYIMGSLSGTLYIGVTGNLHKRAFEHKFHRTEGFTEIGLRG